MLKLTFRQTGAEMMVRIASTLLFDVLSRSGCPSVPLSELSEKPQYGFTARASRDEVGPKFVRITDLADEGINWDVVPHCLCDRPERYVLSPGDILFARTGATTGKTHLISQAPYAVFASYLIRVRAKGRVLPEYLHSFFQSDAYWLQILEEKKGSAQPNVNGRKLMKIQVPAVDGETQLAISRFLETVRARQRGSGEKLPKLPPPLSGQRRIVARIEELAALIEEAQRLRAKAREEAEALLSSALATGYDEAVEIVGGVERLDDLCQKITDGTHSTPNYVLEGVPFLSVKDITSGTIRFDDTRFITPEEHARLIRRCNPERGDVLLTKIGTTGFAKVIDVDREFSIFVSLALLKLDKTRLDPAFTEYMLNSPRLREYSAAGTRGVGNKNLVLKFIREFPMPVPSLSKQHRIVTELNNLKAQVDELTALQNATQQELDALLPSVLDRAFRGEL